MPREDFTGDVALVTGAGSGIGFAVSELLLQSGARVILHYNTRPDRLEALAAHWGETRCNLIQKNFTSPGSMEELYAGAVEWGAKIDILVNNAAIIEAKDFFDDFDRPALENTFRVNTFAPIELSRLAMIDMKARGYGRIVNVSSIGVKYAGGASTAIYSASKAALEAMTVSMAKFGAECNVLVNAIRPGVTNTDVWTRLGKNLTDRVQLIPMRRAAEPDEIAAAILFVASRRNTYITGAVIPVAGGE